MPRLADTPSVAVGILRPRRKQLTVNTEWRAQALCRGKDPEIWHPEQGDQAGAANARAYCERCPVRIECLAEAIVESEPLGVWGGSTERQRRDVRRLVPRRRGMSTSAWVTKVVERLVELGANEHGTYEMWALGCRCDEGCSLAGAIERQARTIRRPA